MGIDNIIEEEYGAALSANQAAQQSPAQPQGNSGNDGGGNGGGGPVQFNMGTLPVEGLGSVISTEKTDLMFLMLVFQTLLLAYIAYEL